jgi:hypothetical protein
MAIPTGNNKHKGETIAITATINAKIFILRSKETDSLKLTMPISKKAKGKHRKKIPEI